MPYPPTPWIDVPDWRNPPPNAKAFTVANLQKIDDEIEYQCGQLGIPFSKTTWTVSGPSLLESGPLNNWERAVTAISDALFVSYIRTFWDLGWTPARNAERLLNLENQLSVTRDILDGTPDYPAEFFTGPLGNDNIVPALDSGALFGVWSGIVNIPGGAEGQWNYLVDHIDDIGRTPDLVGSQEDSYTWGGVSTEDRINGLGAVPVIALGEGPGEGSDPNGMFHGFTPTQIIAGQADTVLNNLADRYASKNYRIMVAPSREFELTVPIDTAQKQADFRNAWIHMVNRFQARGATNVGWYWTPGEQAGAPNRPRQDACYPGHAYVDWVGSTGYCQDRVDVWTSPLHDQWAEFREIFAYEQYNPSLSSFCDAYGGSKPFIPAEVGCLFSRTGIALRKKNWMINAADAKALVPKLRGAIYFGGAMGAEECFVDWRAYSNASALNSFEHPSGCASGAHGTFHQDSWDGYLYWANHPDWNVGIL